MKAMLRFAAIKKMKYVPDNALGILKNSVRYVIVCRHVARRQRTMWIWLMICDEARRARALQPVQSEAASRVSASGYLPASAECLLGSFKALSAKSASAAIR